MSAPRGRSLLLAVMLLPAAVPALARGQLQTGPTQLEIAAGAGATRLMLRNTGDAPVAAQVRLYAWSQVDGEDRLAASDALVASPPIAELPAGGEQVVRVVRTGPPASGRDLTFRAVVDELPAADGGADSRVALRMRYVVPVFVRAADAGPSSLRCSLDATGTQLSCDNAGGRAAQLGASRLVDGAGRSVALSEGLFGYVLPGSRRSWRLPAPAADLDARSLRLDTRLDGQPITLAVERTR